MSNHQDSIIFLGLNKSAAHEVQTLRNQGNKIHFIQKGKATDEITLNKTRYDLWSRPDIARFTDALNLTPSQKNSVVSAIQNAGSDIRDELAGLTVIFAEMQKKGAGPSRLVISGHHIDGSFWGDHNGMLEVDNVKAIAKAFPVASKLIEDVHLSACYSGNERALGTWRSIFPNASTIWAYAGSAPGSYSGATVHLSRWDKATRGDVVGLKRSIVEKTRKGKNVAVWSKKFGYQKKGSTALGDLVRRIVSFEITYKEYFLGNKVVTNTQSGPLREYYNDLQELVGHSLSTPTQLNIYQPRLAQTIRLIYYNKSVKAKFLQHYSTKIGAAYKSLGKTLPNYNSLDRKETLREISKYEAFVKVKPTPEVDAVKGLLTSGLRDLSSLLIPDNWV